MLSDEEYLQIVVHGYIVNEIGIKFEVDVIIDKIENFVGIIWRRYIQINAQIDCKNSLGKWYSCKILAIKPSNKYVKHECIYVECDDSYDYKWKEWITLFDDVFCECNLVCRNYDNNYRIHRITIHNTFSCERFLSTAFPVFIRQRIYA